MPKYRCNKCHSKIKIQYPGLMCPSCGEVYNIYLQKKGWKKPKPKIKITKTFIPKRRGLR